MTRFFTLVVVITFAFSIPALVLAADSTWINAVSGNDWSAGGNWNGGVVANGSGFTADFSTLNITANNTVHLDNGGVTRTIGNLIFGDTTPSGHSWTIDNDGNALNTLTMSGGTPTITVNSLGAGVANISTVLTGSADLTKAGAGTLTFNNAVDIAGDFTLSAGTVNAPVADFAVGGDLDLSGGTFNAGSSDGCKVVLDGAGTQNLTSDGASFYDFKHSGSGTVVLQDAFTLSRNLTNDGGTFNCNDQNVVIVDFNNTSGTFVAPTSATFSISGGCDLTNGTFTAGTGKVILNGGGTQDLMSSGESFFDLEHTGAGTVVLQDALSVSRNLTNNGGTFNCNNKQVVIKDFNNTSGTFVAPTSATFSISGGCDLTNGTFTAGTGTVTFNGSGDLTTASKNFNNVEITGSLSLHPDPLIVNGTLELSGAANLNTNTYDVTVTGMTTMSAGTYTAGAGMHSFNGGLTFSGGTINGTGDITASDYDLTDSGTISVTLGGGAVALTKTGAGTATLSGTHTYTGATSINAGTLALGGATTIAGDIAHTGTSTLDLGSNTLTLNGSGDYTQTGTPTIKVTIVDATAAGIGNIDASGATSGKCTTLAASTLSITVPTATDVPVGTKWTIIKSKTGTGLIIVPGTVTSSNSRVTFSLEAVNANDDLELTVLSWHNANTYANATASTSGQVIAAVLDAIVNATGDMQDVLNILDTLSAAEISAALNTMAPLVNSGVSQTTLAAIQKFTGISTARLHRLFAQARAGETGETGVSTGSPKAAGADVWAQGFGEYLHQGSRGNSNGYHATVCGGAVGADTPAFNEKISLGLSGGYSQSNVNSKDNSGKNDIDSYQATLYIGTIDAENPWYLNGAFSFAYNEYTGTRNIAVGGVGRIANAEYDGKQYSALAEGGYIFNAGKLSIIPNASIQYVRLFLDSYTETNAGALNLNVASQNYDMLQSGLGIILERSFPTSSGTLTPEIHAKWLYDFIGDAQQTTSTFTGGGASFATQGFDPALHTYNFGAKLTLATKGNWSIEADYDFECKEDFVAHTGLASVKYKF